MNFFGVGGPELVVILIVMLVFAGPKRMIHWSYLLGQYVAKFRVIWSQTVDLVQKEFDEAGVDIQLPKTPPTRDSMNKAIADAVKPVTRPVQESLDEIKKDTADIKGLTDALNSKKSRAPSLPAKTKTKAAAKPAETKAAEPAKPSPAADAGSWSDGKPAAPPESNANGSAADKVDMGSWSATAADEQGT